MNAPARSAPQLALGSRLSDLLQSAAARLAAAGCSEARLDAELLLAAACGQSRAWLLAHHTDPAPAGVAGEAARPGALPADERERGFPLRRFEQYVQRRAAHEPVAYILGHKEFYGLDLLVDRRVLIPRPETETLVETALDWLRRASASAAPILTVIDVGTGSGAIALALAAHTPSSINIMATDVSSDALAVARENAARLGLSERISFFTGDLLSAGDLSAEQDARRHQGHTVECPRPWTADLVVANLPYVAHSEWAALAPDIHAYEPHLALDGGPDGLDLYRRLLAQAPAHLKTGGALLLEIGWQQAAAVRTLAQRHFSGARVHIIEDLAGQERVAAIETYGEP